MWLSKDERRLLTGYWHPSSRIDLQKTFSHDELFALLSRWNWLRRMCGTHFPNPVKKYKTYLANRQRAEIANDLLKRKGLINLHQDKFNIVVVSLTLTGLDLCRQYSSIGGRLKLLYASWRKHPIPVIIATAVTIVVTAVVTAVVTVIVTRLMK